MAVLSNLLCTSAHENISVIAHAYIVKSDEFRPSVNCAGRRGAAGDRRNGGFATRAAGLQQERLASSGPAGATTAAPQHTPVSNGEHVQ